MNRAKNVGILLVWFLLMTAAAQAQNRLNFPRVLSGSELGTTGFALVNTSSGEVNAAFSFYGTDGILIIQSPKNVPARGQLALLASEIFPTITSSGWVQVTSSSPELQGFEIVGDFANVVDGAGPAPEGRQLALIDFSREDIVHVVNTSSQGATVQITLNNAAGASIGSRVLTLGPFQPAAVRLGDVNDDNNIDMVSITANVDISAALTTKLPGGLDIGLTNATVVPGAPSTLFFPYAPNGPQGVSRWTTYIGASNLGSGSQTVSLTFTPDSGSPVTIQRTLAPGASVGDTVANLFGVSSATFSAGWVRVSGTSALAGIAAYQDTANGSLAIVPSQSTGSTAFFFGHIASLPPWYTGIALLNTFTVAANVEVYAINSNGQAIGSVATFTLAGRQAALLSQLVPQVLQRTGDGGWVFIRSTNNVPLFGFELFGHSILPILANVQGFPLPPGSTFTPPGGAASTAEIKSIATSDPQLTPKTQFTPGNSIVYSARITQEGPTEPAQLTFTVKDPRFNTLVTSTVTISLISSNDYFFNSFIPSNALDGQYTFTVTLVHRGNTFTKSAIFNVSGGTATPSVGQETPLSTSLQGAPTVTFRAGDTVRFLIITANFTTDTVLAVANCQLVGGSLTAGPGLVNFSIPPGIAYKAIDIVIPTNATQGLYTFSSALTAGGNNSTKTTTITVVP
jgi:hypothetical protein